MQRNRFNQFLAKIRTRLEAGAVQYGDASYDRPLTDVYGEALEEAEDIPGWMYIAESKLDDGPEKDEVLSIATDAFALWDRIRVLRDAKISDSLPPVGGARWSDGMITYRGNKARANGNGASKAVLAMKCSRCGKVCDGMEGKDNECGECGGGMQISL